MIPSFIYFFILPVNNCNIANHSNCFTVQRLVNIFNQTIFSSKFACPVSGFTIEEIEPRLFSFNNPFGACPACDGLGTRVAVDPDLVVPDKTKSLREELDSLRKKQSSGDWNKWSNPKGAGKGKDGKGGKGDPASEDCNNYTLGKGACAADDITECPNDRKHRCSNCKKYGHRAKDCTMQAPGGKWWS